MADDPYKALGLTKSATTDEIKKAYRRLVRSSHPDLHPDDPLAEARFKAISAAHELLKDPATRARFDAGEIDSSGAERPARRPFYRDFTAGSGSGYQGRGGFGAQGGPADAFADMLRNRARGGGGFSASGGDARYSLTIPFLEAALGGETRITLPDGANLAVKIPQGTEDGQTLRLRGKGQPGYAGGPAGDALITVRVTPHAVFRRDGDDILVTLPITIDEAVLGGKVTTPTIDGPVGLTIPRGVSSGHILRLRGRGITRPGSAKKGDQRVELRIVSPPEDDSSLSDFLTEWRKTHAFDPRADLLKG